MEGGFNLNFFKNNRRLSILAQTNNISDQNFTTEDLLGVIGSSGETGYQEEAQADVGEAALNSVRITIPTISLLTRKAE